PIAAIAIALWPVLGTSYIGLPIASGGAVTLIGFALSVLAFERTLVGSFHFLTRPEAGAESGEFTPAIGRRALILGGLGVLIAGGGVGLLRRLYRIATFSYDGTQYKGRIVQPITPNDLFYCVTKNVIDPRGPMADARRVRLFGVDNYTDTIPLEKALDPTTILASAMNGVDLPHRHGYPLRAIVPGYFGEKHVKWLTRIELAGEDVKGLYETQGWGPDFMTPTRSRIDAPDHESRFSLGQLSGPIEVKGIAFGGDRGISRVEISDDDGEAWTDASIHYAGTKLTWALWTYKWRPDGPDDYTLVVRATD